MLEKSLIQSKGFRNVGGDHPTGFQLRVRSPYYRGVWANLLEEPTLVVDGEEFGASDITWGLPSGEYSFAQLRESTDVRWPLEHAAVLTVTKDGGLAPGVHDVSFTLRMRMSYIPEELQPQAWTATRKAVIVR
ncbi:C-glycoside deglycosidase beta subunit domain-containing protein [Microbacterium sp. KNMS]